MIALKAKPVRILDLIEARIAEARDDLRSGEVGGVAAKLTARSLRHLEEIHALTCDMIIQGELRKPQRRKKKKKPKRVRPIRPSEAKPLYEMPKPTCGFRSCRDAFRGFQMWKRHFDGTMKRAAEKHKL